ncbi:MAG TPA: hypothetical protein VMZ53_06285 [Kofleriaceae bacterium]|nr:hypothetical protein [Kofleriaceae bacterium]
MPELPRLEDLFGTALVIPDAIPRGQLAMARERLTGWQRYALLDRGSYEWIDDVDVLRREIVELAERVTSRTGLAIRECRALRLVAGDYLLAHHDRLHDDNPVEVMVDLSPAPASAEVHYRRRGQTFLRVPSVPGTAAVVERGPSITCNHTYVSKRDPATCAIRLVALLK